MEKEERDNVRLRTRDKLSKKTESVEAPIIKKERILEYNINETN